MQIKVRLQGSVSMLTPEIEEAVYLPWDRSTLLAFSATHPTFKELDQQDILLPNYHVGLYRHYLSGVLKTLPGPMLLAYNAQALLDNAAFRDIAPLYEHPTGWVNPHSNVWQIPQGTLGGGAIVVRDIILMAYGRRHGIPPEAIEKKALMRQATTQFLEDLGYVKKVAPDSSTLEND